MRGALAALAVQALLGWLLVAGLATPWRRVPNQALAVFRVPPPPPRQSPPEPRRAPRRETPAAPPGLSSTASEIVVPPPIVPRPLPDPLVAALTVSTESETTSGQASVAGLGNGAGRAGTGEGEEGGGTPPRQTHGRLKDSDYPLAAGRQGATGAVGVRYLVGVDGRVGECDITRSSGSTELDDTTCRLIRQRFRFDPSRDPRRRKVPAWISETHEWVIATAPAS